MRFFSSLQTGLNGALENIADGNGLPASSDSSIISKLRIAGISRDFSQTMSLRGPGDVVRLDSSAVRTVEPKPKARDVAPN
ncbi:MAG TPA: hypothetical protein VJ987_04355, partial [Anaerolineales bacterium]|nr:hypothetical protein [Anaerolineales bacterium]